jgi:hypothetical protein
MKPYPGFSPNFKVVPATGGLRRTCFVLEFRSAGDLTNTQIAMIEEQMSALAARLAKRIPNVDTAEFVSPKRFDRILLEGLRLPASE